MTAKRNGRSTTTSEARFFAKVALPDENGCMNWTASLDRRGYGKFGRRSPGRGWVFAHRRAYEYWCGAIPGGLTLDHLCRNRACVRPDHLEPVTLSENVMRSWVGRPLSATCKRGHPRSGEHLYTFKSHRQCRTCALDMARLRYAARKAAS